MKRIFEITGDGSATYKVEDWDEPYHSRHGAIQESLHVFIANGLRLCQQESIRVLEMGFGTGLNALLSLLEIEGKACAIEYTALEAYPLDNAEVKQLNYLDKLGAPHLSDAFWRMHSGPWAEDIPISPSFTLHKINTDFRDYRATGKFDLVYFDAFSPRVQPELWTSMQFERMYAALETNGILVTYCAKGSVRRAMQENGFRVERLHGPPGKREMLRASKIR
jgi:tRNA U34 5-methylaminomethyl-2-thiouridine-forming methyltransferase MnmC